MRKKVIIILTVLLFIFFGNVLIKALQLSPVILEVLFNKNIELKKTQDRVNVLLLGIGGGIHEGPSLTDTIIFSSIDIKNKKITLVSIPRDLWVADLNARINTAYSGAEYQKKGSGIILSSVVVSKVLGQSIDYVVRIDFGGFVKVVDLLGGINVNVNNELDDFQYPLVGRENDLCGHMPEEVDFLATSSAQLDAFPCRYKHIHFDQGIQLMSGIKALEFVRSRYAKGEEGTDFARSKRQEEVIKGIKGKIFSLNVLFNASKVIEFYNILKDSIDTNIKEHELDDFIKLAAKVKKATINSAVLDYGDERKNIPGLLMHPYISEKYNNEWVLIPRIGNDNFAEIQKYVDCEIKIGSCEIPAIPNLR